MSDLISREALIEKVKEDRWGWFSKELILSMLEDAPTVDAVEVVRCKDCVSFNERHHTCRSLYLAGQTIVNGYCFNGQRKKV